MLSVALVRNEQGTILSLIPKDESKPDLESESPVSEREPESQPRPTAAGASSLTRRHQAELLSDYSSIVRQIAAGFCRKLPRSVAYDDLLAAGMYGLWDAILKHGDAATESFEWYVRVRVRGAIVDELRAQDWLTRRARAAVRRAEDSNEARPGPALVRIEDLSELEKARFLAQVSRDEDTLDDNLVRERLAKVVEQLPERERYIVSLHYFQGVKFKDLGRELGVSEPRISQLHSRAMARLKSLLAQQAA